MDYYIKITFSGFITVYLQDLAIEIFKVKLDIAPDSMNNVFSIIENP